MARGRGGTTNLIFDCFVLLISSLKALVREQAVPFELVTKQRNNERHLAKLDGAMEDLMQNGGFEYMGKDELGKAVFGDVPVRANL